MSTHDSHRARRSGAGSPFRDQAGLTLTEIVAAAAILTIAVFALLSAVISGFTDVDRGRQQSTAVFLAEQRMEEVRSFAMSLAAGQGFANLSSAAFPAQAYGSITGFGQYRRTVTVTDSPGGVANTKQVDVNVFYRPQTDRGMQGESSVLVSTLIARHQ
jgi:Tfp pilus assembly protein PilV